MEQLYTQSHVTTVFILGILHGFLMGGLLISRLKSRPLKVAAVKSKIPSAANTEYQKVKKLLNSRAV